ncbi:amidophosphoribosyltransferase [Chromatiales bacterium (ex Bugula neritina AB1)]|nr:amidophosphoribosyltransferase [Chromatiales bacterium (ex Bugula neritina AB1)]
MCGIIGLVGREPVNHRLYDGLSLLQHRGQDAAGIATCEERKLFVRKAPGLVSEVFRTTHMLRLRGNMGIGHLRYPTAGSSKVSAEAQPFYVNSPFGIVMTHNGNLTNSEELQSELYRTDRRHINTSSDSEVLLNVFAHELQRAAQSDKFSPAQLFQAVSAVHRRCKGSYAVIAMLVGRGVLAFRDAYGIRPAILGKRESENGTEYCVSSESVALTGLGFEPVRDLLPGEAVYISRDGELYQQQCATSTTLTPCIFEYVYFARPDSVIDKVSVYSARLKMGRKLANKIRSQWTDHDIDVVIPIPDTARTSALELAMDLGITYREGFVKNRYIGRTFIMPGQTRRRKSVRQKLSPIESEFRGLNVLLVDDSIVRGTTSEQIIQMAREAGANKVYMASAAPPVMYPNVYGIDMPAANELIAYERSVEQICEEIGADGLIYQDLDDLIGAVREINPELEAFETSCFNGQYVTGDVDGKYLRWLEARRADATQSRVADEEFVDVGME